MKKIYITMLIVFMGASAGYSQAFWTVNYDIGVPLGSFSDFIGKASFRGFSVNGNTYLTDNLTVGGTFHWSGYKDHEDRTTYPLEDGALTSEVWKKMYFTPLSFNARYMLGALGAIQPYVGLGMGPYWVEQETQAGKYISNPKNWKFGLAPDAGVFVPFGTTDWGLNLKASYHAVFYNVEDINTLSFLQFSVGIGVYSW